MNRREQVKTVLLYGVFVCYILLVLKILFLSRVSLFELFSSQREINRSFNLIPFHSIMEYLSGGTEEVKRFSYGNVVGNIILFIPLGLYLPLLRKDKRIRTNLLFVLAASLFAEIVQGLFGIGASDVDDLILNCAGGFIGILAYKLVLLIFRDEKKVRTAILIPSVIVGLPMIFYYLFLIRMKF